MTKRLRVTFNQIFCKDDTTGFGADEIYFLAVPRLLRESNGHTEMLDLPGALSEVRSNVKKSTRYQPKLTTGKSAFEFVLDSSAKSALLVLYLYEEDDGKHYRALRESPLLGNSPVPGTDWGKLTDYVPDDVRDWKGWLKAAYKLVTNAVNAVAKDDLIGKYPVAIDPNDDSTLGYRQFRFSGNGGEYHVLLHIDAI